MGGTSPTGDERGSSSLLKASYCCCWVNSKAHPWPDTQAALVVVGKAQVPRPAPLGIVGAAAKKHPCRTILSPLRSAEPEVRKQKLTLKIYGCD